MAFVPLVLFHFCLIVHIRAAQENQSHNISLGSSISHPSSWPSASGHFAFGFYPQGNGFAVGIWLVTEPENIIVWTANRDDPPVSSNSTLELTSDGIKLRTRTKQEDQGKVISHLPEPANSASMLDSGNFVLYGSNDSVVWQSFDYPTDTILRGQNLSSGGDNNQLVSSMSNSDHSNGRFLLAMQTDRFAAYPVNSSNLYDEEYWSFQFYVDGTKSPYYGYETYLALDYRGDLALINSSGAMRKVVSNSYSTQRRSAIYRATLDPDGIFRLYSHQIENNTASTPSIKWANLQDQCDVKGFCSFNSYCSSSGGKDDCYCYSGFVWRNSSNKWLGCAQNITKDLCRKDLKIDYNMTSMENTWWSDIPYFVKPMPKEDCSRSCREDCNCGAALYESENCKKYKLPLRFGKRKSNISSTAFFKVIKGTSASHNHSVPVKTIIREKDNVLMILSVSLGSIALFCLALALFTSFKYWRQVDSYRKLSGISNLGLSEEFAVRSFSYSELEEATNNFAEELGRGSYGAVYRGSLQGGSKTVAVKRVEKAVEEGERAFRAEMTTIGRTYHRNLVRLLGYCIEGSKKLLVYEYMNKGSLADILFKAENRPVWKERVRIALDVARGIFYLHEECEVHIIHCNIKPQNILIDDSWTAKISDFGLAKLLMRNQTSIGELVSKSRGYSAPEWQRSNLISVKADIYSFGVVLLEIICCRSNVDTKVETEDEIILCSWVNKCFLSGELEKLIIGDEEVDMKTFERMVKVGLWCIQDDPNLRPPIKDVILMLECTMEVPLPSYPAFSIAVTT